MTLHQKNESQLLEMKVNLLLPSLFLGRNYLAAEAFSMMQLVDSSMFLSLFFFFFKEFLFELDGHFKVESKLY